MPGKPYTLISYYTKEWQYAKYAAELAENCAALGVPSIIKELPSTGKYMENTKLKPRFIKDCLEQLKSPVLWVDCDSHLLKNPVFFDTIPAGTVMAAKRKPEKSKLTWYAAVIWLNYCQEVLDFIDRWIKETEGTGGGDHTAMERAWLANPTNTIDIPPDYAVIIRPGETPRGVIALRISDWPLKNKEMRAAAAKIKQRIL